MLLLHFWYAVLSHSANLFGTTAYSEQQTSQIWSPGRHAKRRKTLACLNVGGFLLEHQVRLHPVQQAADAVTPQHRIYHLVGPEGSRRFRGSDENRVAFDLHTVVD